MGIFAKVADQVNPPPPVPLWEPHPKQQQAKTLAEQCFELLYGGAAGGGKSHFLRLYAVEFARDHPGAHIAMIRRALPMLKQTHGLHMGALTAGMAVENRTDWTWTFDNGSLIRFISLYNDGDEQNYKSVEFDLLLFDEVTELSEKQYVFMLTRLRSARGHRAHAIATSNPEGRGFRWVKRRFVKPEPRDLGPDQEMPKPGVPWEPALLEDGIEVDTQPIRAFLPATVLDNPTLMRTNPNYVRQLKSLPDSRLRRALVDGDWDAMDNVPGALWKQSIVDEHRVQSHPTLVRIVIGVDPSGSNAEGADECGIVAVGKGDDGHLYVLRDVSGVVAPEEWSARTAHAYDDLSADRVIAEKNFGGDMVRLTLKQSNPGMPVRLVNASRGKAVRAEPISWVYTDGRIHHVGHLPQLEDELTTWKPESGWSPGRLDALVWACTELLGGGQGSSWMEYLRRRAEAEAEAREKAERGGGEGEQVA